MAQSNRSRQPPLRAEQNRRDGVSAKASPVQIGTRFGSGELIIGLVGAVGTPLDEIDTVVAERLKIAGYNVSTVNVTRDVMPLLAPSMTKIPAKEDHYARLKRLMDAGNYCREKTGDNSILAIGAASIISAWRDSNTYGMHSPRAAFIVRSFKHPDEVTRLREIYPNGFYLIGVHADESLRLQHLTERRRMSKGFAKKLMKRDADERIRHGQRVTDTFHMSDFFVHVDDSRSRRDGAIWRLVDILMGHPYRTPIFDEYAMFLAFAASLRSADMSRQVGAVVTRGDLILATGANDCPRPGGGLYCAAERGGQIKDEDRGRDYIRGVDANRQEQRRIIDQIVREGKDLGIEEGKLELALDHSAIRDLTEFGRVVHAEMDALLSCARAGHATGGADLYCTTFPCHNCAKHIIAAGIRRVVYIEPYQKSKAADLHDDAIHLGFQRDAQAIAGRQRVAFEPFVGVGPRRFFDLFSMRLGSGYNLNRKEQDGSAVNWKLEADAVARIQMLPCSYLDLELSAARRFQQLKELIPSEHQA